MADTDQESLYPLDLEPSRRRRRQGPDCGRCRNCRWVSLRDPSVAWCDMPISANIDTDRLSLPCPSCNPRGNLEYAPQRRNV